MSLRIKVSILTSLALFAGSSHSACAQEVAKLYSTSGVVDARKGQSGQWVTTEKGTSFTEGDALRTGVASKAAYVNNEGILVRLNSGSVVEFGGSNGSVAVQAGDAYFLSKDPHEVPSVTTSLVSGSVRGTEFAVSVRPGNVKFSVINGQVDLENKFGRVVLTSGEEAVTEPGKPPVKRVVVKPFDAVQWGLRFPAIVSLKDLEGELSTLSQSSAEFLTALEESDWKRSSELTATLTREKQPIFSALLSGLRDGPSYALKTLGANPSGNDFSKILQSGYFLEGGDVQQSADALATVDAQKLSPSLAAMYYSQLAIHEIVKNNRETASSLAKKALELNPSSLQARFTLSLTQQSSGDISGALTTLSTPDSESVPNALLLARKAELTFGSGDNAKAEELVEAALKKDPHDGDALTVQGFILLTRDKIDEARTSFEKALASRSAPAPAHLGLGLAEFRSGNKEGGRMEIQKAVHLDPTNSLFRSYLAKSLFELNRFDGSTEELQNSKKLDPLDPTADIYEAFNHLATYKPVAALESVEEAIKKNDNRFVFRSKLLLDQDRATRAVGLGRVFSALDFFQPIKISAQKALAEDPSNYSAHLLLKDALSGDPSADSAVVVEDSTAMLLAPSTFSSTYSTASGGASLNEYTTLFEQGQSRTLVDFIGQSKERGFDASTAHIAGGKDHSFLFKYGATVKRGFRDNDYTKNHIGRFAAQYDVTADDKILLDTTFTALDRGDTLLSFNPLINDPNLDITSNQFTGRMGYRHTFDAGQHVLAQLSYIDLNQRIRDAQSPRLVGLEITEDGQLLQEGQTSILANTRDVIGSRGFAGDTQHILNRETFSLVSGVGFVSYNQAQSNRASVTSSDVELPPDFSLESRSDTTPSAFRGYSYLTLKPVHWLNITGGSNYTNQQQAANGTAPLVDDEERTTHWSPRVGMLLSPTGSLTLRGAYFQRVAGASANDIDNLEPVQVGGIRTTFLDNPGVQSENYGFGIDWKIPKSTYLGVEFLHRKFGESSTSGLDIATFDTSGTQQNRIDSFSSRLYSQEQAVTGYFQQILSSEFVSSLEHTWSLREDTISDVSVVTNKTRVGLNYYHPSGFFSFGSGTYRHQDRENYFEPGDQGISAFWIFTAGCGWQLPNRHGAVQLVARNIFDETFTYEQPTNDLTTLPGSDVQLAINLNF